MADDNVIPMTHETADRDYQTEIAMATREVDRLTDELAEARFMIQQLEDVFRLNTAAQLLPVFLGRNECGGTQAFEDSIQTASEFVDYYKAIMERNAADFHARVKATTEAVSSSSTDPKIN
jgi:hypothetical protein